MYQQLSIPAQVFTLEEVASYLKFSQERVEQLAQNGEIPGRKVDRSWRFLRTAVDDWLTGREAIDNALLHSARQLSIADKLKLLDVLAEELGSLKPQADITPLESGKTYQMPTLYNAFGAGQALMNALEEA